MRQNSVLSRTYQSDLEQIINELIFALKKTFSEKDLVSLAYLIVKESGKQTFLSKKHASIKVLQTFGKISARAYLLSKTKIDNYKNKGIKNQLSYDINNITSLFKKTPEYVKQTAINFKLNATRFFKKTKEEKIEMISIGFISLLVFFATAGGKDLEGGIPDTDLKLGIGYHRHFLSHTIITGFITEFFMRTGIEILNKAYINLPKHHHSFWDRSNELLNKHKGVAIGAMWAGIGAHLLKDSGFFGHGIKAYNGMPVKLKMTTHQALFAANGSASMLFSINEVKTEKTKLT